MNILGINAYHANASAALVCDGQLVAAAEEERFNRVKYAAGFPVSAIRYCLKAAGLAITDIDHIAVPRNPWARMGTKLLYAMRMPYFARERAKAWASFADIPQVLAKSFEIDPKRIRARFHRVEHHRAHLASAFFVSPFDRAALLSADGLGDFASTMWATGEGSRLRVHGSTAFPHSLGIYYTALTQYLGFWSFGDEYKVMGLAAYGEPTYMEEFRCIVQDDGVNFRLGLEYFSHHRHGAEMSWREADKTPVLGRLFSEYLEKRLGPTRQPDAPLEQKHKDIAASLQARLEEVLFQKLKALYGGPVPKRFALREVWHLTVLRTEKSSAKCLSKGSSSSPQRAMRASRWARPFTFGTNFSANRAVFRCDTHPLDRIIHRPKYVRQWTKSNYSTPALMYRNYLKKNSLARLPGKLPKAISSDGFRGGRNGGHARSEIAAFLQIRDGRR